MLLFHSNLIVCIGHTTDLVKIILIKCIVYKSFEKNAPKQYIVNFLNFNFSRAR